MPALRPAPAVLAPSLVMGAACVMAGTLVVGHLPVAIAGPVLALALLRRCWIEGNIHDDLIGAATLPQGYRNARIRQERWVAFWNPQTRLQPIGDPGHLASILRRQALGLSAFLYGSAAAGIPVLAGTPVALVPAAGLLLLGLRRADSYAVARGTLVAGGVLSADSIAHRGGLAARVINGIRPAPPG